MKTIVTGGTGFIGSHLVKSLLDQGREVIVISDWSRLDESNLSGLGIRPADVELRRADLSDSHQALETIESADTVFHLAARVGSLEYLHGTETAELVTLRTNLLIDANVFQSCLEKGISRIIYASSCAVYGLDRQYSHGAVFSEADLDIKRLIQGTVEAPKLAGRMDINPDGGYGWAKLLGEIQLGWMRGVDIGIARIFNIYGENEPLGEKAHAIADLIRKAIRYPEEKFIVSGDGKQSRDFLYVSDCADALLQLENKTSNPPVTVNIGSGQPTSISTIAQKAVEISGKTINITYDPTKPAGPISRTADTTRAKIVLNWQPKLSLDEGLRHTYAWIQSKLIDKNFQ